MALVPTVASRGRGYVQEERLHIVWHLSGAAWARLLCGGAELLMGLRLGSPCETCANSALRHQVAFFMGASISIRCVLTAQKVG